MSYGLSPAGYDIRTAKGIILYSEDYKLSSSVEYFSIPDNLLGVVHDKSTWARRGVCVQNTIIEPGWRGYLTLEISYHGRYPVYIEEGSPIAQVIFHHLDVSTDTPYNGKYQDQKQNPQEAIFE
jgi:dCTP deaminase